MKEYNKMHVGETFTSSEGYEVVVTGAGSKKNFVLVSIDGVDGYEVQYVNVVSGAIKNPYRPSVYGVGYFGVGSHKSRDENGSALKYRIWVNIIRRCYDPSYSRDHPTFEGAIACDEWHNFQNFGDWYDKQYKLPGWQLSKDLLNSTNSSYSPDTCAIIPSRLRLFLIGVRKKRGELPVGVVKSGKKFLAMGSDPFTGKREILGKFLTVEPADLEHHRNKEQIMRDWTSLLRYDLGADHRIVKGMESLLKDYTKEIHDLEAIIESG